MTLTEFLLARIAEDYQWRVTRYRKGRLPTPRELGEADRWEAECEAKRRIVEAFKSAEAGGVDAELGFGLVVALRAHAAVYASHPDYREEWAL